MYYYYCCCPPEVLQQRIAALEQERNEFIRLKQQLEAEFNQKRAKFKELYLSKEGRRPRSHQFGGLYASCLHMLHSCLSSSYLFINLFIFSFIYLC